MLKTLAIIGLFAMLAIATSVYAEEMVPRKIGQSADWQAYYYLEERQAVCALVSRPIVSMPQSAAKREVVFYITRRKNKAGGGWFYELAVMVGTALSPSGRPVLRISERQFSLFSGASRSGSEAEWAWVEAVDLRKILALMRAGAAMEITAQLEDGTSIRDRYSLLGVTAGLAILGESCP